MCKGERRGATSRSRRVRATLTLALLSVALGLAAGCRQKIVRVRVPPESIMRANEIAREGDVAFARRDFYAALIRYLEATRLNPNSEYILNKLGITYSQLKYYPEAINAFQRSIGLNPKYPFAYNNLGTVYFAEDDKRNAEKYFRRAIGINPNIASFYVNLGMLYIERGKKERAMEALRRGLQIDPEALSKSDSIGLSAAGNASPSERSYLLARLWGAMGNVERTIELLQQAVTAGFTNFEAIQTERDFDPVRQDQRFIAFMKTLAVLSK